MEVHNTRLNELFIDFYYYHVVATPTTSSTPIRNYQLQRDWSGKISLNDYIEDDYSPDIKIEQGSLHQESPFSSKGCPEAQALETETESDDETGVLKNPAKCDGSLSNETVLAIHKVRVMLKQTTGTAKQELIDLIANPKILLLGNENDLIASFNSY
jgi:hypothetical protein